MYNKYLIFNTCLKEIEELMKAVEGAVKARVKLGFDYFSESKENFDSIIQNLKNKN